MDKEELSTDLTPDNPIGIIVSGDLFTNEKVFRIDSFYNSKTFSMRVKNIHGLPGTLLNKEETKKLIDYLSKGIS